MRRVLIVDDSPVDRQVTGRLLSRDPEFEIEYATGGLAALTRLGETNIDVVVTDLVMPNLTGLQLAERMRYEFPQVPVVLVTSQGNELVAVDALQAGVASYVPKSELAKRLHDTVQRVLRLSDACAHRRHLLSCMVSSHAVFRLENNPSLVPPLVQLVKHTLEDAAWCDPAARLQVGVALEEALLNALYHGNLEMSGSHLARDPHLCPQDARRLLYEQRRGIAPFCHRSIKVELQLYNSTLEMRIQDEGPGFDQDNVADPISPENIERECGRGLLLMRAFMDAVIFNDIGNEVTLIKNLAAALPRSNGNLLRTTANV